MDEEKILYTYGVTIDDIPYAVIPPTPTTETRGGFVAEEKTDDDSLQVSIESETGKAYAYKPKSDKTLSVNGGYADAKVTGDKFSELEETKADKSMIGNPITALSSSDFKNTRYIYVYLGDEEGYVNGDWYYYNGQMWVDGGKYGVLNISRSVPTPSTGNGVSEVAQKLLANILNRSAYVLPQRLNIEGLIEELASTDTEEKWAVVYDLENVTSGSEVHSVVKGEAYNTTLTYDADTTDVTIFMGDLDVTEDVLKDKVVSIKNVTGHVTITDQIKYVKFNTNLTGATISTSLTKINKDYEFEFNYFIQDGYELESITVLVGEDNVTEDSVYPDSQKIVIDKCYDDVTVTIVCGKAPDLTALRGYDYDFRNIVPTDYEEAGSSIDYLQKLDPNYHFNFVDTNGYSHDITCTFGGKTEMFSKYFSSNDKGMKLIKPTNSDYYDFGQMYTSFEGYLTNYILGSDGYVNGNTFALLVYSETGEFDDFIDVGDTSSRKRGLFWGVNSNKEIYGHVASGQWNEKESITLTTIEGNYVYLIATITPEKVTMYANYDFETNTGVRAEFTEPDYDNWVTYFSSNYGLNRSDKNTYVSLKSWVRVLSDAELNLLVKEFKSYMEE